MLRWSQHQSQSHNGTKRLEITIPCRLYSKPLFARRYNALKHKARRNTHTTPSYPIPRPGATKCPNVLLSHKLDAPLSQPQAASSPPLTGKAVAMPCNPLPSSVSSAKTKMQAIHPLHRVKKTKTTKNATYETSSASKAHPALPQPIETLVLQSWDSYDWHKSSDALADWINGRWGKTGYSVSKEVVCFTLRMNGRDARLGLGDHLCGSFFRGERRRV
jgi:hypothetical protein